MSGVDTDKYSAGSVRPAAVSKAKAMAVPIKHIMAKAGWSREATFAKYYNKIIPVHDPFQDAVDLRSQGTDGAACLGAEMVPATAASTITQAAGVPVFSTDTGKMPVALRRTSLVLGVDLVTARFLWSWQYNILPVIWR
ncbi:hypothetical protein E2C01_054704 [Portunus trituberculatus]|uniref:Uncharacterized protein n=1 Tax=Portunus trituberculatus TaxID=210409 RepID=A0A5B7GSP1_PORTR|nr:hypothetical protein [Portunus trituberculatus]